MYEKQIRATRFGPKLMHIRDKQKISEIPTRASAGDCLPALMMTGEKGKSMIDKNGIEFKTGDIVEITGAYFKNDNGLYFVDYSPGDPAWCGSDHCLKKISKKGRISVASRNICFWPIGIFVSDRRKAAEARSWNAEHAQIEVKSVLDITEVVGHFREKIENTEKGLKRLVLDFGEESQTAQKLRMQIAHYEAVIARISN